MKEIYQWIGDVFFFATKLSIALFVIFVNLILLILALSFAISNWQSIITWGGVILSLFIAWFSITVYLELKKQKREDEKRKKEQEERDRVRYVIIK